MPIYEYRCENGHVFEAFQSMTEDALDTCEVCDAPAARLLSAPAVHFKGSGFYTTDYARKGAKKSSDDGGSSDSDSGSSESKGEKKSDGKSSGGDSKSSAKAGSGSSKSD